MPNPMGETLTLHIYYQNMGRQITVSGKLTAQNIGAERIEFFGAATGFALTDTDGNYQTVLQADGPGPIQAKWAVYTGNPPVLAAYRVDSAIHTLWVPAPVIEAARVFRMSGNRWCVDGSVSNWRLINGVNTNCKQDVLVRLDGTPLAVSGKGLKMFTEVDGTFEFQFDLNGTGSDNGAVWLIASNGWVAQMGWTGVIMQNPLAPPSPIPPIPPMPPMPGPPMPPAT